MHGEVLDFIGRMFYGWKVFQPEQPLKILEFGSLDINGSIRSILQRHASTYIGIDLQSGPGVDLIGNASTYESDELFDVVVCCEVFEHTPEWRSIIDNSHRLLTKTGLFLATMAGEGRSPHSAIDENPIRYWEYYDNIGQWELNKKMKLFSQYGTETLNYDLRAWGIK